MKYNSTNKKQLDWQDSVWIKDNQFFECSVVKSHDDRNDNDEDTKNEMIYSNGDEDAWDISRNKTFTREFKKWVTRIERIDRDILWECDDGNFDDKLKLMMRTIFTFWTYRNLVKLNTLLKCAEYVGDNFLNKIDYKVMITYMCGQMDYKDDDTYKRLEKIFKKLDTDNNNLKQVCIREDELAKRMRKLDTSKSLALALKDIKTIQDNKWIIVYRGFIVSGDDDIRLTRRLPDDYIYEHGYTKQQMSLIQNAGRGISFTFCKKTAYALALLTNSRLRKLFSDNSKVVVGQYLIRTEDILTYTNRRSEREVITDYFSLLHYEFVSRDVEILPNDISDYELDDESLGKTSIVNYEDERISAIHNLKSDLKIHRIYNNTEKLQKRFNN